MGRENENGSTDNMVSGSLTGKYYRLARSSSEMLNVCRKTRVFSTLFYCLKHRKCLSQTNLTLTSCKWHSAYSNVSCKSLFVNRNKTDKWSRFKSDTAKLNGRQLVYEGPLSRSVQLVKAFSLSTALATIAATPVLMIYGKESVPLAGKLALGSTVLLAGTSTTLLLHWLTKVYVHKMFYDVSKETFAVETMTIFARRKETEFALNEIKLAKEPTAFTTFKVRGKKYFLHTDLVEAQQVLTFIRKNRS